MPAFLQRNNQALLHRYEAITNLVSERTRTLLGDGWRPYQTRSFFRRMNPELRLPWHLDADTAKLEHSRRINVWLPLDSVGSALPSLELIVGSHRKTRVSQKQKDVQSVVENLGKPWAPRLDPGDALIFDQFTAARVGIPD